MCTIPQQKIFFHLKKKVVDLAAPRRVGSSRTRDRTCVSCTNRQILIHCATREAPRVVYCISWSLPSALFCSESTSRDPRVRGHREQRQAALGEARALQPLRIQPHRHLGPRSGRGSEAEPHGHGPCRRGPAARADLPCHGDLLPEVSGQSRLPRQLQHE